MILKIKKEVIDLCLQMLNNKIGSEEWMKAKDELIEKWKFTPLNLLALYEPEPVIELNNENKDLVTEEEDT